MNSDARLIVFEGVDAAGKSTICAQFMQMLKASGVHASLLSFPGKTEGTIGELIYRLHHKPSDFGVEHLTASSLQTLHIAAHLDAIETVILPRLESGETIVLDRYWWSTWVYGFAAGVNADMLDALIEAERIAWGSTRPTSLFYVTRGLPLRKEPLEQWYRVKAAYDKMLAREHGRYPIHIIENEGSPDASVRRICQLLPL